MIVSIVRKRASGLIEILARTLRDCGREVEVEDLRVHLPRVLKTPPTSPRTPAPPMKPPDEAFSSAAAATRPAPSASRTGRRRPVPRAARRPARPAALAPGQSQDLAVRVSPFVERAHPRPGDDHGPDIIAVTLQHPGGGGRPCGDAHVCFRVPRTASAVVQQHRAFDAAVSRACRRTAHLSGTHVVPPTTHAGRHGLEARVAAGDCVVGDRWGPRW